MSEIRTPPSLKWLLVRRARLLGEIERHKQAIDAAKARLQEDLNQAQLRLAFLEHELSVPMTEHRMLEVCQNDLDAIDGALKQHEIQVNTSLVRPIRSQIAERHLEHGQISRYIYRYLKSVYPSSATATEIATFIIETEKIPVDIPQYEDFRDRVRQRLKNLTYLGKIAALHPRRTRLEGRWRLHSATQALD